MFTKSRAFAAMAAGAGALMLVGTAPASAAPAGPSSQGATPYRYDECYDFGYGTTCYSAHGEYNIVQTPSGNSVYQSNGKFDYTVTFVDGQTYSNQASHHYHETWKKGEPQVIHQRSQGQYEYDGQTCTYSYTFHYANGEVRISDFDDSCWE